MSNASDQRIRHVAIVLQSLDANTSRGLLAQLPAEQSKRVRQAMVQMGTVSTEERQAAFQSMQGLLKAANIRSGPSRPTSKETLSPAAALLASQRVSANDHVEFSPEAVQQTQTSELYSGATANQHEGHWQHMPAEALADILLGERPIVIATVFNQVSVERATAISKALPLHVAAATLAALPHLHLTDAAVLRDIQLELERKIGQYQAPKQANAEGLAKLQAIVASMPVSQQSDWTNAIAQSNPVLATKLGWSTPSQFAYNPVSPTDPLASLPPAPLGLGTNHVEMEFATNRGKATAPNAPAVAGERKSDKSTKDDIFDESMIIPFPGASNSINKTLATDSKQNDEPKLNGQESRLRTLDELLHFSDRDFVAVLHACKPQTVLLALSGAAKPFVARVERLMPAKDVKRLRERLNSLGPIQLRDIDAAQSEIAGMAMKLMASGVVAATASVSFTAAA